jgi:dTDP-4-amino-4,6-dideoxygalactose transaminase
LRGGSVVSANSGTGALIGAILATAGRASSERPYAVVPAFTFVATALAAEQCGYRPYLLDVDSDTWQLQPETLAGHPRLQEVGLVVPVAPYGRAVPQAPWLRFRQQTGIPVVIDGGASFEAISADPATYLGAIPVALSFHATKSFATAEGGCVITSDSQSSVQIAQALNFGFFSARECRGASTNGKMSEYHAAVGLAELDGWPEKHAALDRVAMAYRRLARSAGVGSRLVVSPQVAGCYALFRCSDDAEAAEVVRSLSSSQIESRFWYGQGLHRQPYYADASRDTLSVTETIAPLMIALPIAPDLPETAIRRVVSALAQVLRCEQEGNAIG